MILEHYSLFLVHILIGCNLNSWLNLKTQTMKKVFLGLLVAASFAACTSTETKTTETVEATAATVEHLYKPTYTDNFKMGDQKNVMLAEQFHKVLFEKDFKAAGDMMSDTATMNAEDGSVLKGKAAIMEFMEKSFAGVTFKNFQIVAIFPVVGENGHEWVDIWDEAELVFADGKSQKFQWMDAFRFENGKIVHFVGFGKAVK
jgi:predicted SnoaL-like aldol condensation-catalyzing enzyme